MTDTDDFEALKVMVSKLRAAAAEFPQGRKRDRDLYSVLASGLRLARILARPEVMIRAGELLPEGKFIKWTQNDEYGVAARLIFDDRYLAWRASFTLRGLANRQVRPEDVIGYLVANGGINAFTAERQAKLKAVRTRSIRFKDPIVMPRGGEVLLHLRHIADTTFEVISCEVQ